MSSDVSAARVGLEAATCLIENFQCVPATPVFPVEAEYAAIGRSDDVAVRFGGIAARLSFALDARAVQAQEKSRTLFGFERALRRRNDAVILNAAVDLADKRPAMMLGRIANCERDFGRIKLDHRFLIERCLGKQIKLQLG